MINLLFFPGKKSWGFINLKNLVSCAMNTAVAPDAYGYVILPGDNEFKLLKIW